MKTTLLLLFSLTFCALADAESPIPSEVVYATDMYPAKDFVLWKENDRKKYNGTYAGDIGGDTEGSLTINYEQKVTDLSRKTTDFLASGIYKQRSAGSFETVVLFKNAFSYEEGVADAGSFSMVFVTFERQKGVIVGKYFLPRKK